MKKILFYLILLATPCSAQEVYGPEYIPEYVFHETELSQRTYNFSEHVRNDSDRYEDLEYNPILSSESLEEVLRRRSRFSEEFEGCIISPIPIDDYHIGCYFQFKPETEDHRVDVWE